MSTIAWRRILPVGVLLITARDPKGWPSMATAVVVAGIAIAYAYEYGLLGVGAALCIHAARRLGPDRSGAVATAVGFLFVTVLSWLAMSFVATGGAFGDYPTATGETMRSASGSGLGGFAFYWTVHFLALVGVLAFSVAAVGMGLSRIFASRSLKATACSWARWPSLSSASRSDCSAQTCGTSVRLSSASLSPCWCPRRAASSRCRLPVHALSWD